LRKILGIWAVDRELVGGDVGFRDIWKSDGYKEMNQHGRFKEMMDIFDRGSESKGESQE